MAANGLIGRKIGMTRIFEEDGTAVPVTVLECGPCPVLMVGDDQVQLGWGRQKAKSSSRAEVGHAAKAGIDYAPRIVRSFQQAGDPVEPGTLVTVEMFNEGDRVKVTGTSKGRGFQGVVHRYGFGGGPGSHGNTRHRNTGSIGPGTNPSRVIKGKKMPGHHGDARHTELGLRVVRVDTDRNLLFVRGAVPGARNGIVIVARQGGKSRHD